jgi:hypothetical protein
MQRSKSSRFPPTRLELRMVRDRKGVLARRSPIGNVGDHSVLKVLEVFGMTIGREGEVSVDVFWLGLLLGLPVHIDGENLLLEDDSHLIDDDISKISFLGVALTFSVPTTLAAGLPTDDAGW